MSGAGSAVSITTPSPSQLRRSALNALSRSLPAGWKTHAPTALQRSSSRASTSSARSPSGGAEAGDVNVKTTSPARTPSTSLFLVGRATLLVQRCWRRWATPGIPQQACAAGYRYFRPRSRRARPLRPYAPRQLRRSKGHVRSHGIGFTHALPSLFAIAAARHARSITAQTRSRVLRRHGLAATRPRANDSILRTALVIPDEYGAPLEGHQVIDAACMRARTSGERAGARCRGSDFLHRMTWLLDRRPNLHSRRRFTARRGYPGTYRSTVCSLTTHGSNERDARGSGITSVAHSGCVQ